jgi:hypothetical protein
MQVNELLQRHEWRQAMDATSTTLVLGLATIFASGVTSAIVTYHLNRNQNQTIFLREKAEQLYLSADEFGHTFDAQMLSYFPLLDGKIDYNKMLDMQISSGSEEKRHGGAEIMTMLVDIYFPSVRPALQGVWEAREQFGAITHQIKLAWQRDGNVSEGNWRQVFLEATRNIDDSVNALQSEIVKAARIHAGVKQ